MQDPAEVLIRSSLDQASVSGEEAWDRDRSWLSNWVYLSYFLPLTRVSDNPLKMELRMERVVGPSLWSNAIH